MNFDQPSPVPSSLTRRRLIQVGALGVLGLSLPDVSRLRARAAGAASDPKPAGRPKKAERGLLDETLIVMAGEFGRTPLITTPPGAKRPGRNHWGPVQTVFFAGGGV